MVSKRILLGAALSVVLVVGIIYVTFVCPQHAILGRGTNISISPRQHFEYGFNETNSNSHGVYGGFTADNGVTYYLMTRDQLNGFDFANNTGTYLYTTGQVTSAFLEHGVRAGVANYSVNAGLFYVVFYNAGQSATLVNIVESIRADTC